LQIQLSGVPEREVWTLQDSYDSVNWRDLDAIARDVWQETADLEVPRRFFRAVKKAPATPRKALDQAMKRRSECNLKTYMFTSETFKQLGPVKEVVSVAGDDLNEAFLLTSPDFFN
jgi:hypothetical protein